MWLRFVVPGQSLCECLGGPTVREENGSDATSRNEFQTMSDRPMHTGLRQAVRITVTVYCKQEQLSGIKGSA